MESKDPTYPIIFGFPTHDSTLLSNKARILACSNRLFVVDMAGVEQGNVSRLRDMSAFTTVTVKISKTNIKKANCWKKTGKKFNLSAKFSDQ